MSMMGTGSNFRSMWKFVLNMLSKMVSEDCNPSSCRTSSPSEDRLMFLLVLRISLLGFLVHH